MKACIICGEQLPATSDFFYVRTNGSLRNACKSCHKQRAQQYRDTHLEQVHEKDRRHDLAVKLGVFQRIGRKHPTVKKQQQIEWERNFNETHAYSYRSLHEWVTRNKKRKGYCSLCGKQGKTQWANISGEYQWDLSDFEECCPSCHQLQDKRRNMK